MKLKEFGPHGGARVPGAPLRSANDLEWRYWCVQHYITSALNTLVHFLMKSYSVNLNFIKIKNRGELGPDFGHVVVWFLWMNSSLSFMAGKQSGDPYSQDF